MPTPEEVLSAIAQAAVERAAAGPFQPDGTLTPGAAAEVQAILDQADDPEALRQALESGTGD